MNKEEKIIEFINEQIRTGKLGPGDKILSEYGLAELFGVNKSTANKAVGKLVERGVLRRLRGAAGTVVEKKLLVQRGVIAYRTSLLSGYSFCSKMLKGAGLAARMNGYALCYYENEGAESNGKLWHDIAATDASGVLATCSADAPLDYELPVLYCGSIRDDGLNYVHSDDYQGAVALAELVLERGHRSPVVLSHDTSGIMQYRVRGFFDTFAKAGISDVESRLQIVNESPSYNPANVYRELKQRNPDCSVLLCASDAIAINMIQYLEKVGVSVPEDFSVTGFAYMPEYQYMRHITTVNQFPEDIGYAACQKLIEMVENQNKSSVEYLTHAELVKGDTVGFVG